MTPEQILKREREIMEEEKRQIAKHKWYESERAKTDIGWEKALLDWVVKHRAEWYSWFNEQLEIRDRTEAAARGCF